MLLSHCQYIVLKDIRLIYLNESNSQKKHRNTISNILGVPVTLAEFSAWVFDVFMMKGLQDACKSVVESF